MRNLFIASLLFFSVCSCDTRSSDTANAIRPRPAAATSATPVPTASVSKDGDYNAKGTVTKINMELGSVELDHEDIPGLMPPMRMEFYVSDKKMLDGLRVGDQVNFVLRYKAGTETIVKLTK